MTTSETGQDKAVQAALIEWLSENATDVVRSNNKADVVRMAFAAGWRAGFERGRDESARHS